MKQSQLLQTIFKVFIITVCHEQLALSGNKYYRMNNIKSNKFRVNCFISKSRLIKSIPESHYSIQTTQQIDISIKSWNILFLTMNYHCKFPRYFQNKLEQPFIKKIENGKLLALILIESEQESSRFADIQMICLKNNINCIPCFTIEEARQCLQQFMNT